MASKIKISELPALTGTVADSYNIPIDDGSTTYKVSVAHFEEAAAHTASEYAAAAAASAEAAAGSAGEAATTATTIETDIGTATRLVNDARGYASSAADSVTAAQAASGAATTKANEASNSANAAAGSAGEAAASATTASNYVTNAQAEANRAKSWADYPNATGSSGDATHNAHYWADVAQAIAGGGVTSFNGRGGVVVPEAGDYSAGMISYDNTSSGLTATDAQAAIDEVNTDLNTLDTAVDTLDTNKANASQLAAVEDGETSSAAYTAGDYISRNGVLYEVIAAIAIGDSFTVGTNIQATTVGDEVGQIKTDLSDYHVVPSRNHLRVTKTILNANSVTWTRNSNDTFTANGTASGGNSTYWITADAITWTYGSGTPNYLPKGRYKLINKGTGAINSNSVFIGLNLVDQSNTSDISVTTVNNGESPVFEITDANINDAIIIYMRVASGQTVSNVPFYPMIVRENETNHTYEPYFLPMRDGKFDIADEQVLGAWNTLKNDATTQTVEGATFTVNSDSTITINRPTATGVQAICEITKGGFVTETRKSGTYYLSGVPSGTSGVTLQYYDQTTGDSWNDYGSGVQITVVKGHTIKIIARVAPSSTVSNVTVSPMIALKPNMPYVPYAMTNMELTEGNIKYPVKLTSSNNINDIKTPGFYYWGDSLPTNLPGTLYYSSMSVQRLWTDGKLIQIIQRNGEIYTHAWTGSAWNGWYKFTGTAV